jgi:hypothetical protein
VTGKGITIFECGKPVEKCEARGGCPERSVTRCQFQLTGKKAGQACGRRLCAQHVHTRGKLAFCEPHARLSGL